MGRLNVEIDDAVLEKSLKIQSMPHYYSKKDFTYSLEQSEEKDL